MTPYDEDDYLQFDITPVDEDTEDESDEDTDVDGVLQDLWDISGTQED